MVQFSQRLYVYATFKDIKEKIEHFIQQLETILKIQIEFLEVKLQWQQNPQT